MSQLATKRPSVAILPFLAVAILLWRCLLYSRSPRNGAPAESEVSVAGGPACVA